MGVRAGGRVCAGGGVRDGGMVAATGPAGEVFGGAELELPL